MAKLEDEERMGERSDKFVAACEDGVLCDERYCPYLAGITPRMGACEGDFCEQAWLNYCEEKGDAE